MERGEKVPVKRDASGIPAPRSEPEDATSRRGWKCILGNKGQRCGAGKMKLCCNRRGLLPPFTRVCVGGASADVADSEENLSRDGASKCGPDK